MKKISLFAIFGILILTLAWSPASQEDDYHEILTIGRGEAIGLEWEKGSNTLIARTRESEWFYNEQLETVGSAARQEGGENPDGSRIAFLNEDLPGVEIRDTQTGDLISVLEGEVDRFVGRGWSPDSRWLAVSSLNDTDDVILWDSNDSSVKAVLSAGTERLTRLVWGPDSQYLIGVDIGTSIYVWDVEAGELVTHRDDYPPTPRLFDILWNPDGEHITVTRNSEEEGIHTIEILDIPSLEIDKVLVGHNSDITEIVWIDETYLASSDKSDFSIWIWNTETGEAETVLEGHSDGVFDLAYNPTNGLLASRSSDSSIRLWNLSEGVQVAQTLAHNRGIMSMTWSPDGEFIATGGFTHDPRIRIWDASNNDFMAVLEGHTSWINSLSWHPDGRLLASGSSDGTIKIWDATTFTLVGTLIDTTPENRNNWSRRDIEWSSDGRMLASATTFDDRIWDVESGELIFLRETTYGRQGDISVTWCSDGEILAVSGDGNIRTIDVQTQEITLEFKDPVYGHLMNSIDCHGTQLVLVGRGGALIDLSTGNVIREFSGRSVAWHPSGERLATTLGGRVYILNADDSSIATTFDTGLYPPLDKIEWSLDGTRLAVANTPREVVHIWGR